MMIETRGPTLEEIAKIFDGEEAEVAHMNIDTMEKEHNLSGGADHVSDTGSIGADKRVPHSKATEV